jgi:hypothetical protein
VPAVRLALAAFIVADAGQHQLIRIIFGRRLGDPLALLLQQFRELPRLVVAAFAPGEARAQEIGGVTLLSHLLTAADDNGDGDITPILDLLDQGCSLDFDILPIVARMVPTLPRPLKSWGAHG